MDQSLHVTADGLYAGLVIGFGGGWLYAVCRRAWKDLAGAKSTAAAAGKNAWARTFNLIILGFLLAVAAALMLGNIGHR